jgi:hypothetical protein
LDTPSARESGKACYMVCLCLWPRFAGYVMWLSTTARLGGPALPDLREVVELFLFVKSSCTRLYLVCRYFHPLDLAGFTVWWVWWSSRPQSDLHTSSAPPRVLS